MRCRYKKQAQPAASRRQQEKDQKDLKRLVVPPKGPGINSKGFGVPFPKGKSGENHSAQQNKQPRCPWDGGSPARRIHRPLQNLRRQAKAQQHQDVSIPAWERLVASGMPDLVNRLHDNRNKHQDKKHQCIGFFGIGHSPLAQRSD